MEAIQVLHMNGGNGDESYANNSSVQRKAITIAKPIVEEAIKDVFCGLFPKTLCIADMGCSSGPNTFYAVSQIVEAVDRMRRSLGCESPEFLIHLNDLSSNDFNTVFGHMPRFKEDLGCSVGSCFITGVPGSFYERLFPSQSLHFVHSSYSLHWLSQDPESKRRIGTGRRQGVYMFWMSCVLLAMQLPTSVDLSSFHLTSSSSKYFLWHSRLGHVSHSRLKFLCNTGVLGDLKSHDISDCSGCKHGKFSTLPFHNSSSKSCAPFDLVHSDVWGPAPIPTKWGSRYYVSYIDDYTRYVWVFLMKHRSEFTKIYTTFQAYVKTQHSAVVTCFRSDLGGEYTSGNLYDIFIPDGIVHRSSCNDTPQQNGVAKRIHRRIVETIMINKDGRTKVPEEAEDNKGNIYLSTTSPPNVVKGYFKQFSNDFSNFLRCRAMEVVVDGCMVVTLLGRRLEDSRASKSQGVFGLLSKAINDMVNEGLIEEEKLDSFNVPIYFPSVKELKALIDEEGSFIISCIGLNDINWNSDDHEHLKPDSFETAGLSVAKDIRAVCGPLLASHFGENIIDEVFCRFAEILSDYMSKEKTMYFNVTISLKKRD